MQVFKFYISFAILSCCGIVRGQFLSNDPFMVDNDSVHSLTVGGHGYYHSSILDNESIDLFRNGGFYSDDLKAEAHKRLGNLNYLGGESSFKVEYSYGDTLIPEVNSGFYVQYERGVSGGVLFSKGLYETVFYGNQFNLGDTTWLSRVEMAQYAFHKFGGGVNFNNRLKLGLSIMSFDSYQYGSLDRAFMYTPETLDSVYLDARGEFESGSGTGIGLDFEIVSNFFTPDSVSDVGRFFIVGVRNLGAYFGKPSTQHYRLDTAISYQGFEVSQFTDVSNTLFEGYSQDSLLPDPIQKGSLALLPAELYFYSPVNPIGKKVQAIYGFRYRIRSVTQAMLMLGMDYRNKKNNHYRLYAVAGGYGYFQFGASVNKHFGPINLGVAFNNVHGMFSKEGYGKSLGISMSYDFKYKK